MTHDARPGAVSRSTPPILIHPQSESLNRKPPFQRESLRATARLLVHRRFDVPLPDAGLVPRNGHCARRMQPMSCCHAFRRSKVSGPAGRARLCVDARALDHVMRRFSLLPIRLRVDRTSRQFGTSTSAMPCRAHMASSVFLGNRRPNKRHSGSRWHIICNIAVQLMPAGSNHFGGCLTLGNNCNQSAYLSISEATKRLGKSRHHMALDESRPVARCAARPSGSSTSQ